MTKNYSVFENLCRDAGNYKVYGSVILRGNASESDKNRLKELLNGGQWFIAEQVGLPPLFDELWKYSDGQTEDDLPFHEFVDMRPAKESDLSESTEWGAIQHFLNTFEKVGNRWDITKSKCQTY